ncbi:hypothetical protein [Flavobacterium laiguense]|uniref:Uncharacterized protein n=1 Tax=Flavobacterium laiguense TaxID=2169409 RepID=A0A2U1JUT4_9FLAO|nr:hypothetical protein [Flavobacterium laiguense]PWA08970.1 hypothetical protein DB891_09980 [Flavobacterium laiguense]
MRSAMLGTAGIGVIEGVQHVPPITPTIEIVKIAIQLVVGIITVFKMFKKPKEVISNQNQN